MCPELYYFSAAEELMTPTFSSRYQSAQASITKSRRLGGYVFQLQRPEIPDQGVGWRAHTGGLSPWLIGGRLLPASLHGLPLHNCSSGVPLLTGMPVLWDQASASWPRFSLITS